MDFLHQKNAFFKFTALQNKTSYANTPGYDIAQFCSIDRLGHGTISFMDNILVTEDYQCILGWSKKCNMESTEKFWSRGLPRDKVTFKSQLADCVNKSWYKALLNKDTTLSLALIFTYSGHGTFISETNRHTGKSPVPLLNHDIARSAPSGMRLKSGDWQIHHAGYFGFDFMLHFFKNEINNADIKNKTLIVLSDCCFSGNWCAMLDAEKLINKELSDISSRNCNLVIQASTGSNQFAHGGIFTPVWTELQNPDKRARWLQEYQNEAENIKKINPYKHLKSKQVPMLASMIPFNSTESVVLVNNVGNRRVLGVENGGHTVALFNNDADFFWFCALDYFQDRDFSFDLLKGAKIVSASEANNYCQMFAQYIVVDAKLKKYNYYGKTYFFALYRVNINNGTAQVCSPACNPICSSCSTLYEVHVHYNETATHGSAPTSVGRIGFNKCNSTNNAIRPLNAVDMPGSDLSYGDWNPVLQKWLLECQTHLRNKKKDPAADIKDHTYWNQIGSDPSFLGNFKADVSLLDMMELDEILRYERFKEEEKECDGEDGLVSTECDCKK